MGILEIIALVMELAPKMIDAGKSVADLWQSAGGIIKDAEVTGKVDPDAEMRLRALVEAQLRILDQNTAEAMNTQEPST